MNYQVLGLWIGLVCGALAVVLLAIWAVTGRKNTTLQRLAGVLVLVSAIGVFGVKYLN